jgi:hypothetical protein
MDVARSSYSHLQHQLGQLEHPLSEDEAGWHSNFSEHDTVFGETPDPASKLLAPRVLAPSHNSVSTA